MSTSVFQRSLLNSIYALLIISTVFEDKLLTVNGYTDTNIVQQRAKLRTINDNIVIETPRNRNITLVPGSGGFVVMGKNVIDPNQLYKDSRGPQGPRGPPGATGPAGSPDTANDIMTKLKHAGIDLHSLLAEVNLLKQELKDMEKYSLKGTYPAIFEFFNNKYGERYNTDIKYGQGGLLIMTRQGGILLGQHIQAEGLESGTTYALSFYLESDRTQESEIDVKVAGSDKTDVYINDKYHISCGDGDAMFKSCSLKIPPGKFKLTLVCFDTGDVLESIGFDNHWLPYNNLRIDFSSMTSSFRDSSQPQKRRKK